MPSERENNGVQAMLRWPKLNLIKTIVLPNLVLEDANNRTIYARKNKTQTFLYKRHISSEI